MRLFNQRMGTTFIFSTHDQKVLDFADHYLGLEDGRLRYLGLKQGGKWVVRDEQRSGRAEASHPA